MARVSVLPEQYTMVNFDGAELAAIATSVADDVGLPADFEVTIEVDETSPFGYNRVRFDGASALIHVESGALENPKRPRTLSPEGTREFLARIMFRLHDRLDPAFGDPPADEQLTYEQKTAWDSYSMGRYERLGHDAGRPRRQYHFRLRHGFTDVADRAFERLWAGEAVTWADVEAVCAETAEAKAALIASV